MAKLNVRLPNGKIQAVSYPDNWTQEQVQAAISKHLPVEARSGLKGIGQDIAESFSELPEQLASFFENLPEQAYKSGKQVVTNPVRAAGNIGAGLLEGGKGFLNIPANVADYLNARDIGRGETADSIRSLKIPDTGLEKAVLGEDQEGDELLRGLASFIPYARAGGFAKGLAGAAKRGAAATAYATGQNQNPLDAFILALGAEGAGSAINKIKKPGTFLPESPLTDSELQEALRITKGTETGLGDVLENPFLKRQLENVLPEIPFSGANQAAQRTAQEVTSRGENILNELKGDVDTSDLGQSLFNALKKSESETRKIKNSKFKDLNDAAAEEGITTNRSNLRDVAEQALKEIEADPDLALLTDNATKTLLKNLSTEKGAGNYSLRETDFLRGKLGDKAHDAYLDNNSELSNIYRSLRDAANKDINSSITNSGNKRLDALRDDAMNFYKREYAPFEEPEIMKFTKRGGDPDLLASYFVRNSKIADRANLLSKLTSKLSPEERKLLSYSYFSRSLKDGELNPSKLKTAYDSLGERQKRALLTEDGIKKLDDFKGLVQKNIEPLNIMFNPKTGQRGSSILGWSPTVISSLSALATGSIPLTAISAALPTMLAKPIVKTLTNPKMRERIVESLIKSRAKNELPQRNVSPLIQALMQASQNAKQRENN